jgi:hypothetical protein
MEGEGSTSFLKKRSKKLFRFGAGRRHGSPQIQKFFGGGLNRSAQQRLTSFFLLEFFAWRIAIVGYRRPIGPRCGRAGRPASP